MLLYKKKYIKKRIALGINMVRISNLLSVLMFYKIEGYRIYQGQAAKYGPGLDGEM